MRLHAPVSKFQELELAHADEGQLVDIRRSETLTTQLEKVEKGYFLSPGVVGSIASISMAILATNFAFAPAAAVINEINADIGPSANASLFTIVWTLCSVISITLFGRISDKFGRRWFVLGASICGFIGGIIACTAQTMNTLVGANVLLGLAAGVHTCYGLIVGEICPNKYKFFGVGLVIVPQVISTGFGAYIGIKLAREATWRWIYYVFLFMMGLAIILQFLFYRPPNFKQLHGNDRSRMQELKRIDWIGAFLLVAGLVLFLLGISWGGQPQPWSSSLILGLTISGGITLVAFVFWEMFSKQTNPLIPMWAFRDIRGFVMLCIISGVSGTVYLATSIIWPSQVSVIYAQSITSWEQKAWASTTISFGIWAGIVFLAPLIGVVKHVKIQLIVLMGITVSFMGALASCNSTNFGQSAAFSFLGAFPAGILEVMTGLLVQMDANDADLGTVFSIVFFVKQATGTVFTAVFVAILGNKEPVELRKHVTPAALAAGLPKSSLPALFKAIAAGTSTAMAAVPGINAGIEAEVAKAVSNGYAAAYAYVYYAAAAIGAVGFIACLAIKDYDSLFNNHVPRQIYKTNRADVEEDEKTAVEVGSSKEDAPAATKSPSVNNGGLEPRVGSTQGSMRPLAQSSELAESLKGTLD